MNTDEREAQSLGRWLDQPPGTTPPDEVDGEAVEAVYALRPDLAPAARVTADDILALVTKGPLAGAGAALTPVGAERGGEVVPFPARRALDSVSEAAEESTPLPTPIRRRGRFLVFAAAAGGTGGIGLALVAAATLMLVAVPALRNQGAPSAGAPFEPSPAASSAPGPSPMDVAAEPVEATRAAAEAQRPAAAPPPARVAASTPAEPLAKEMADGRITSLEQAAIPELQEMRAERATDSSVAQDEVGILSSGDEADAVADAEVVAGLAAPPPVTASPAASPSAPTGYAAADEAPPVDALSVRSRAIPTDRDGGSWRAGVDADTLADIDRAIEKANALRQRGNRRGAGDALAGAVQPPSRAGQYVAALAADDYLAAGDPKAAAGVAQRGLSLGSDNTPERSWLLVKYGDALRAQDQQPAAIDAYEQASDLNVDR